MDAPEFMMAVLGPGKKLVYLGWEGCGLCKGLEHDGTIARLAEIARQRGIPTIHYHAPMSMRQIPQMDPRHREILDRHMKNGTPAFMLYENGKLVGDPMIGPYNAKEIADYVLGPEDRTAVAVAPRAVDAGFKAGQNLKVAAPQDPGDPRKPHLKLRHAPNGQVIVGRDGQDVIIGNGEFVTVTNPARTESTGNVEWTQVSTQYGRGWIATSINGKPTVDTNLKGAELSRKEKTVAAHLHATPSAA